MSQIRGGSKPSDNGGAFIQTLSKEGTVSKFFFRLFGPQFGLKIKGGGFGAGPLYWIRYCKSIWLYEPLVEIQQSHSFGGSTLACKLKCWTAKDT